MKQNIHVLEVCLLILCLMGTWSWTHAEDKLPKSKKLTQVQKKVKEVVENMTGLNVTDVEVRIAGITMPQA